MNNKKLCFLCLVFLFTKNAVCSQREYPCLKRPVPSPPRKHINPRFAGTFSSCPSCLSPSFFPQKRVKFVDQETKNRLYVKDLRSEWFMNVGREIIFFFICNDCSITQKKATEIIVDHGGSKGASFKTLKKSLDWGNWKKATDQEKKTLEKIKNYLESSVE